MIIALLAAVISTADSFFIEGSSSIVNDIIRPNIQDASQTKMLFYSRISVLIVSLIALLLALMIPGLVNLMVTGTAMAVSGLLAPVILDRKSTRLNSSHVAISYAVFCLKKYKNH